MQNVARNSTIPENTQGYTQEKGPTLAANVTRNSPVQEKSPSLAANVTEQIMRAFKLEKSKSAAFSCCR